MHRGKDMSLAMLPQYIHITDDARLMSKLIKNCITCQKLRGVGIKQPLGPLHENQLSLALPFEDIVMDGFGSFFLANGKKFWGLDVVCRSTKALKLCVLEDNSGPAM